LEYASFSSQQQFVYTVIKDIEVDNMSKTAEYPVLFSVDKQKLHSFEPYMIELLAEWSLRDERTFVDFCGTPQENSLQGIFFFAGNPN